MTILDTLGNVLALPFKLILWNRRFDSHCISPSTEARLVEYLNARNRPAFKQTQYRLNEYSPIRDLRALWHNRYVAWPYRLLIGLPVTLLYDVLLPGRLFPWGDYYNPYTNTAHLYSDDPPILLHEAGHAYDFADFPYKGTYAALRIVPFVDLYQEYRASDNAIDYVVEIRDRKMELHAYRVLWPAYGTYVGGYIRIPFGTVAGAAVGHIFAAIKVAVRKRYYKRIDAVLKPLPQMQPTIPAASPPQPLPSQPTDHPADADAPVVR